MAPKERFDPATIMSHFWDNDVPTGRPEATAVIPAC